jgi:hypothetical protein
LTKSISYGCKQKTAYNSHARCLRFASARTRYYENPLVLLRPFYILSRESCKTFAAIKTRSCVSVSPLSAIHRALRLHAGLLKIKKPQKAIGLSRASGGAQLAKIYRISFRPSLWLWLAAACTTPPPELCMQPRRNFRNSVFAPPQNPFFVPILAAAPPTRQGKHTRRSDGNFFLGTLFSLLLCYSRY